jgi:hypothetical protein
MQVLIWIFVCVLIPLVGINYASRMILLCLLPADVELAGQADSKTKNKPDIFLVVRPLVLVWAFQLVNAA